MATPRGSRPPAGPIRGSRPPADPIRGSRPPADPIRGSRPPADPIRGSRPPADHPRPTMVRPHWALLEGRAGFAHDDQDVGLRQGWFREGRDAQAFDRTIRLPFPPESRASGIGDTGFHPVVWYRIAIPAGMLESLGHGPAGGCWCTSAPSTDAHRLGGGRPAATVAARAPSPGHHTDCAPDPHHIVVRAHDRPHRPQPAAASRTGNPARTPSGTNALHRHLAARAGIGAGHYHQPAQLARRCARAPPSH